VPCLASILILAAAAVAPAGAAAQPVPDYDFQWRVIGAPGNRPASQDEAPHFYPPFSDPPSLVGSVNYEYRMSRTEVTAAQWLEFLNAYWPHYTGGNTNDPAYTSFLISRTNTTPGQNPNYQIVPGYENMAVDISWRYAARYCNWLTNGKQVGQAGGSPAVGAAPLLRWHAAP
jgi:formylglycine-generating enzyme required for sulfatase activity